MITQPYEDKDIHYAYSSIHDFFDTYLVQDALLFLHTILKAAISKKPCKMDCPYRLLHYMDNLGKLCNAAFAIHNRHAQREMAIIGKPPVNSNPNITVLQGCTGGKHGDSFWSCFPRNLTLQQFYDPYKAIKKFCSYMPLASWSETFSDLQEFALSPATINEMYPGYNMLKLQLRLAQLIESCHLLDIRSNNADNNKQKNKKR